MAAITKQDVLKKIDAILKFTAPEAIEKYAKDGNYRYYLATGVRVKVFNEGDPELSEVSLQRLMWQIPGGMKFDGVFEAPVKPEDGKAEEGGQEPEPEPQPEHKEPEPPVTVPEETAPETKVEEEKPVEDQVKSKASVVK